MKKLAGTHWGANLDVLKTMYVGRIRPTLEYGMAATSTASKTQKDKRNRVQNQAMRIMTGALCTTPISCLETITGLQSLEERADIKVLTQAAKYNRLPEHPINNRTRIPKRHPELKKSSFLKEAKKLGKEYPELLDQIPEPLQQVSLIPPWKERSLQIETTIPGIGNKDSQPTFVRKNITMDYLESIYNPDSWTEVYTDGSSIEATKDGGAGVYIKYNDSEARFAYATGKFSTNYKAESMAMKNAAEELMRNSNNIKPNIVILTDALSVLEGLENTKEKELDPLREALAKLGSKTKLVLQWIPAHCGIPGNEIADGLAKEGSGLEQTDRKTSYREAKTHIKRYSRQRWLQNHPDYCKTDPYYHLSREDQVIIFRLRTGHNRMNAHMKRINLTQSDFCPCGNAPMTPDHILQDCHNFIQVRRSLWPQRTPLRAKLFCDLRALQRTAKFVKEIKITIKGTRKKKNQQ